MADSQKTALLTGATSGIGRELARLFAQDKYNLVLVARSQDELTQTAADLQQHGGQVTTIAKDLFERNAPFEVYDEVKTQGIQVDGLVNDAGQGQYGQFTTTDIHRELDIIQLNIGAYVTFTKLYLQEMVARGEGKILQVSSLGAEIPGPLQAVYHGTKAFVTSFTEAVREETKETGVTITILEPGVTDTDFFHKADPVKVAQDGYEALMAGQDKIISGLMNKAQAVLGHVLPDSTVAAIMHKQAEPVDGNESAR